MGEQKAGWGMEATGTEDLGEGCLCVRTMKMDPGPQG